MQMVLHRTRDSKQNRCLLKSSWRTEFLQGVFFIRKFLFCFKSWRINVEHVTCSYWRCTVHFRGPSVLVCRLYEDVFCYSCASCACKRSRFTLSRCSCCGFPLKPFCFRGLYEAAVWREAVLCNEESMTVKEEERCCVRSEERRGGKEGQRRWSARGVP